MNIKLSDRFSYNKLFRFTMPSVIMKANTYTKRFAEAEEIAKTIFWLGTAAPEYINGFCADLNNGAFPR